MKTTFRGTLVGAAMLMVSSAAIAGAQLQNGTWRVSPQPAGSRAVQAPQQTTVVVVPANPSFNNTVFRRQPVLFTYVPTILMSDGSVFADFGFGYEPVTRSCGQVVVSNQIQVVAANGFVLSQPPTYTQPVPNQATASQQMLSGQTRTVSAVAQSSCFTRDASGSVFVVR